MRKKVKWERGGHCFNIIWTVKPTRLWQTWPRMMNWDNVREYFPPKLWTARDETVEWEYDRISETSEKVCFTLNVSVLCSPALLGYSCWNKVISKTETDTHNRKGRWLLIMPGHYPTSQRHTCETLGMSHMWNQATGLPEYPWHFCKSAHWDPQTVWKLSQC